MCPRDQPRAPRAHMLRGFRGRCSGAARVLFFGGVNLSSSLCYKSFHGAETWLNMRVMILLDGPDGVEIQLQDVTYLWRRWPPRKRVGPTGAPVSPIVTQARTSSIRVLPEG